MGPHEKDSTGDATRQRLADAAGPAFAVSLDTLALLQATPSGRAWLGAQPPPAGASGQERLDAAMPAVARLRALAAVAGGTRSGWRRERLTFWTAQGVRSPVCAVSFVEGATGEKVAVVVVEPMDAEAVRPQSSGDGRSPPRDDMATLRDIARRIREGQRQLQSTRTSDEGVQAPEPASGRTLLGETPHAPQGTQGADAGGERAPIAGAPPPGTTAEGVRFDKLAHELKTPLSAIAAAAEIMRDERLGPIENARYKSYAADIVESARHALHVIANMLGDQAARRDGADATLPSPMVFTELDLNVIAESSASSMRPLAEAAGLQLDVALRPRLPHVIADATAVRQIVLNLLTNAVKFTPSGGRVTLATRYTPEGQVDIEITDTGCGMTREDMSRVEEAPERAPEARQGGGFGLGLPLVGALARANGAEVVLSSGEGLGTRAAVVFKRERVVPV